MENTIDEEVREPSPFYRLTVTDEEYVQITEAAIMDEKINKGIHSLKFNHNDQYLAAGINLKYLFSGYRDGKVRIYNAISKTLTCTLDCNKSINETLVQSVKWRPKIEGRTNNILMTVCRDTMTEWHVPSSKLYSN